MLLCNAKEHLHLHVLLESDFIFPAVVTQQSKEKKAQTIYRAVHRTGLVHSFSVTSHRDLSLNMSYLWHRLSSIKCLPEYLVLHVDTFS